MVDHEKSNTRVSEFDSAHREADQKIPMHTVYVSQNTNGSICVVAEDTDIYLSLISISHLISSPLFSDKERHEIKMEWCITTFML